ncbi:hypothetical protein D3C72_862130 [compost metagenome]
MTVRFNHEAIAADGFTQIVYAIRQTMLRQQRFNGIAVSSTDLNDRAQLFVKQRRQTVVAQRSDICLHTAVAGESHLGQCYQQAAV